MRDIIPVKKWKCVKVHDLITSFKIPDDSLEQLKNAVKNYISKAISTVDVPQGLFVKQFKLGSIIELPFLKGILRLAENRKAIRKMNTNRNFFTILFGLNSLFLF